MDFKNIILWWKGRKNLVHKTPYVNQQRNQSTVDFSRIHACFWIYFKHAREGMEKAMAPHSSTLAWRIPQMEEPGGLQSMGLHRVGHDLVWNDLAAAMYLLGGSGSDIRTWTREQKKKKRKKQEGDLATTDAHNTMY